MIKNNCCPFCGDTRIEDFHEGYYCEECGYYLPEDAWKKELQIRRDAIKKFPIGDIIKENVIKQELIKDGDI